MRAFGDECDITFHMIKIKLLLKLCNNNLFNNLKLYKYMYTSIHKIIHKCILYKNIKNTKYKLIFVKIN